MLPSGDQTASRSACRIERKPRGDAPGGVIDPEIGGSRAVPEDAANQALPVRRQRNAADQAVGSPDCPQRFPLPVFPHQPGLAGPARPDTPATRLRRPRTPAARRRDCVKVGTPSAKGTASPVVTSRSGSNGCAIKVFSRRYSRCPWAYATVECAWATTLPGLPGSSSEPTRTGMSPDCATCKESGGHPEETRGSGG